VDTRNKIFAVIGTVAILATSGTVGALLFTQQDTTSTSGTTTTSQNTTLASTGTSSGSSASASTSTSSYKDGTYTASQSYRVPHGGQNTVKATVVIASGKITAVTTSNDYTDGESGMYIQDFESSVSGMMVGKSMGSMMSSRIGGASLTSSAFYNALDTIATQAQA
jgi:uncharacterized protein with FMN-binding domain